MLLNTQLKQHHCCAAQTASDVSREKVNGGNLPSWKSRSGAYKKTLGNAAQSDHFLKYLRNAIGAVAGNKVGFSIVRTNAAMPENYNQTKIIQFMKEKCCSIYLLEANKKFQVLSDLWYLILNRSL